MRRSLIAIAVGIAVLTAASSAKAESGVASSRIPAALWDVACHAPSTCMAVGPDSSKGLAGTYSVAVAVDGAKRWVIRYRTSQAVLGPIFISCGSANACAMAGNLATDDQPVTYWTTNRGESWHLRRVPTTAGNLGEISCATPDVCAIVGGIPGVPANEIETVAVTFDGGASWVRPLPSQGLERDRGVCLTIAVLPGR